MKQWLVNVGNYKRYGGTSVLMEITNSLKTYAVVSTGKLVKKKRPGTFSNRTTTLVQTVK